MIRNKITKTIIAILIAMPLTTRLAFAHSGRTDSSGGHKDNKNVSGLGSYHYHCGGYPAHLHDNGVCPYKNTSISSDGSSSTTSEEATIAAKKKEASDLGYNTGYTAGCNGYEFNDTNSSSYSSEYKTGYSNGYEKGKSELETNINNAYNEGYEVGYRCELENNTHTVQAVKDSYSKGYTEGRGVYIEENTNNYIQYGEEDANKFTMRSFEANVPNELKEKYTVAYNNKTTELKNIAYDRGYLQALNGTDSDSSTFNNEEEVNSYNEGYKIGVSDLESERNFAYEAGYGEQEYVVPEKFVVAESVLMTSYNEGVETLQEEKAKKAKAVGTTAVILLGLGAIGGTVVMKNRKLAKKETIDIDGYEDKVS